MKMRLERFTEADAALFTRLAFNEEVMRMNYGRTFTAEEAEGVFGAMLEMNGSEDGLGYYKVFLGDEYAGLGALCEGEEEGALEIEYMLLPACWGRGCGTELVKTLTEKAAEHGAARIRAITDPKNVGSQRVLEKNGFAPVKRYLNDEGEPVVLYERAI